MFAQGIYLILQFIQAKHKQKGSLEPLFQKKKKLKSDPTKSHRNHSTIVNYNLEYFDLRDYPYS